MCRLVCQDGELKINSMIAGLIFSELSSTSVFNLTLCEYTVILPDFKIGEIISLVQDVLRLTPGSDAESNGYTSVVEHLEQDKDE